MRRGLKLTFALGFLLLGLNTGLAGYCLLQLQKGIELRTEAHNLQSKLDDVLETLQETDNLFLIYEINKRPEDYQGLINSIQKAKVEIETLIKLPGQTDSVQGEIRSLRLLMSEKFKFTAQMGVHEKDSLREVVHSALWIHNNIFLTSVISESIRHLDANLNQNVISHEGFVHRYFWLVIVAFFGGALVALALLFAYAFMVSREIHRRNELEKELRQAQSAALVASSLKSQFLATVSHEIRTPLNGIIGMSDMLRMKVTQPETRRYAEIIQNSGQSLLRIVNDILDFSKMEAGKIEFEMHDFSVPDVVNSALELFSSRAAEKQLSLFANIDRRLTGTLVGDSTRISQILHNLIGNAVKFTSSGSIYVRAVLVDSKNDQTRIRFCVADTGIGISKDQQTLLFKPFNQIANSLHQQGTGLGLSISKQLTERMGGSIGVDSQMGQGSEFWFTLTLRRLTPADPEISDFNSSRLIKISTRDQFDRFFKEYCANLEIPFMLFDPANPVQLSQFNGDTFLILDGSEPRSVSWAQNLNSQNLHLVATPRFQTQGESLLKIHRLRSPVTSHQLDQTLRKALGIDTSQYLPSEPMGPDASLPFYQSGLILVVEDNPTNQILAQTQLQQLGFQVHVVGNGKECLEALTRVTYDLILMDCRMPILDGYETTKAIRVNETRFKLRRIPILAMTANAISGDREKCLAAGMDDYMAKPLDLLSISRLLKKWLAPSPNEVDWSIVKNLESKTNPDVVKKLILSFSGTLEKAQKDFIEAFSKKDFETASAVAHHLRSSAAALGAVRLADQCALMEEMVDQGRTPESELEGKILKSCELVLSELHDQKFY